MDNRLTVKSKSWRKYPQVSSLCERIDNVCFNIHSNREALLRIGSESMDAMVFKVDNEGCDMAVKVLFDISEKSKKDSDNELKIAKYLSEIDNSGDCFLHVYGSGYCADIDIPYTNVLIEKSKRYNLDRYLKEKYKIEGKRFAIKNRGLSYKEYLDRVTEQFGNVEDPNVSGHLLYTQMLWGDLIQLIENEDIDKVLVLLDEVIPNVFSCIQKLHDLSISHNDLHLGNVLLKVFEDEYREKKWTTVIHDFGKSEFVDVFDEEIALRDFHKFAEAITKHQYLKNTIIAKKMESLLKYTYENDFDINNIYKTLSQRWKSLSKTGGKKRRSRK